MLPRRRRLRDRESRLARGLALAVLALVLIATGGCRKPPDKYELLRRGDTSLILRELYPAQMAYEEVLELDPGNPYALYGLAQVHMGRGDAFGALDALEQLRQREDEVGPDRVEVKAFHCQVIVAAADRRARSDELSRALGLLSTADVAGCPPEPIRGRRAVLSLKQGELRWKTGDREGAIRDFRTAAGADPSRPDVFRRVARALLDEGHRDQAVALLREALVHHSEDSELKALMVEALGR